MRCEKDARVTRTEKRVGKVREKINQQREGVKEITGKREKTDVERKRLIVVTRWEQHGSLLPQGEELIGLRF